MPDHDIKSGGLKAGLKNLFAAGGAVFSMTLISIFLADLLIYPIVLFHTTVIQVAGPLFIAAFIILTVRSVWIYIRREKIRFQNSPAAGKKMFLPVLLWAMSSRFLRLIVILFFISTLFILMTALILFNTGIMF